MIKRILQAVEAKAPGDAIMKRPKGVHQLLSAFQQPCVIRSNTGIWLRNAPLHVLSQKDQSIP
ncbi:MAG: hypothetical protein ABFD97_19735 [Syntrophobacter sp.]